MINKYLQEARDFIENTLTSNGIEYKFQEGELDPLILNLELDIMKAEIELLSLHKFLPHIQSYLAEIKHKNLGNTEWEKKREKADSDYKRMTEREKKLRKIYENYQKMLDNIYDEKDLK